MAEEEETTSDKTEDEAPKKKRKGVLLGGGIVGMVALAYIVSLAAVPKAPQEMPFQGPFVIGLSQGDLQVNLAGEGGKRFLVMTLQAEFDTYDETYAANRILDPLYQAKLKDVLISLGRQKSKEDLADRVGEDVFKHEIRDAVDPLLFPLHVGNDMDLTAPHEESGLRGGESLASSTMRGGFHSHVVTIDTPKGKIALDDGEPVSFDGTETDLALEDSKGGMVYVDLTEMNPDFVGDVPIGTFGRVRSILFGRFLVQ